MTLYDTAAMFLAAHISAGTDGMEDKAHAIRWACDLAEELSRECERRADANEATRSKKGTTL